MGLSKYAMLIKLVTRTVDVDQDLINQEKLLIG